MIVNQEKIKRLGNIYNENAGTGYAGNVWSSRGLCPTLTVMEGGGRQPMVITNESKTDSKSIQPAYKMGSI